MQSSQCVPYSKLPFLGWKRLISLAAPLPSSFLAQWVISPDSEIPGEEEEEEGQRQDFCLLRWKQVAYKARRPLNSILPDKKKEEFLFTHRTVQ